MNLHNATQLNSTLIQIFKLNSNSTNEIYIEFNLIQFNSNI
jgi:hypothetical protein